MQSSSFTFLCCTFITFIYALKDLLQCLGPISLLLTPTVLYWILQMLREARLIHIRTSASQQERVGTLKFSGCFIPSPYSLGRCTVVRTCQCEGIRECVVTFCRAVALHRRQERECRCLFRKQPSIGRLLTACQWTTSPDLAQKGFWNLGVSTSLLSASTMAAFAKWPWQVPCHAILLETQHLIYPEHLHLGCFRVRLPPVTSAFSSFPCNPQPKSSRQLLPSYWESHLCFAWWKETCVMTDWFGVSLLSLTVDNLHTLVLSSVWPAGSWSMLRQLVVSEESSILLVLNLCHVVSPEAFACGERLVWCRAKENEPHQHVAKWRALPSCERFGMKTCNERQQVCWQCCRMLPWIQPATTLSAIPSIQWCRLNPVLTVVTKTLTTSWSLWTGIRKDSLGTLVLSSVWPAGSWTMWPQVVASEGSSVLLVLNCRLHGRSTAGFRMGWAAKNEPHQHVAKRRVCPVVRDWDEHVQSKATSVLAVLQSAFVNSVAVKVFFLI